MSQTTDLTSYQQQTLLPPSPDAAALGKYGNVPVNTYTGVPDIQIPIYTIKSRDLEIPITLSYHASGVTVEEESGWTGLGWVLSGATGVITRQIRGKNDLVSLTDGFYHNFSYSNYSYKGFPYDAAVPSAAVDQAYITNVCTGVIDPEPDIFYYNFLGKAGSFILEKGQDMNSTSIIGTPIKAEKIDIRYDKISNQWIITTPDGFKFYFNVKEMQEIKRTRKPYVTAGGNVVPEYPAAEESYYDFEYYSSEDFNVNSWYIAKIMSPLGETANFVYDLFTPITSCVSNGSQYSAYGSVKNTFTDEMDKVAEVNFTGTNGTTCWGDLLSSHFVRDRTQIFTAHMYLKEIQFTNGKITFSKSAREDVRMANDINAMPYNGILNCTIGQQAASPKGVQRLDSIKVVDNDNNVIRQYKLGYSYFNNSAAASTAFIYKRLKLISVTECDGSSSICNPSTQLLYDESNPLPSKYSHAMDFWGYYNGANANPSRVPKGTYVPNSYTTALTVGDADRQPNEIYMTSGTLQKIIYPTGGSTDFVFEPHDYYYYGSGAFTLTDFQNNNTTTTQLASLSSVGGTTTDITTTMTIGSNSLVDLKRTLGYYPVLQSNSPCTVTSAFAYPNSYNVASPFIIVKRVSDNTTIASYTLGEYDNFMSLCSAGNSTKLMSSSNGLLLSSGTYLITLKQFQAFQSSVTITQTTVNARSIPINESGVYAKTAGGLRIKSISNNDAITNTVNVKSYDYNTSGQSGTTISSGRLMQFPLNHVLEVINTQQANGCGGAATIMYGKSFSVVPLGTSAMGSIVGYDKITVHDGTANANGRTELVYDNVEESLAPNAAFFYGMPNIINTSNGNLKEEWVYNSAGGLLKKTINTYGHQLQKNITALAFRQTFTGATTSLANGIDASCYSNQANQKFDVIADRWVPTNSTETTYDLVNATPFTRTTLLSYDVGSHLQLAAKNETSSGGQTITTSYTYPNQASWIPAAMWQTNFMYTPPVQTVVTKNSTIPVSDLKLWYKNVAGKYVLDKIEDKIGASTAYTTDLSYPVYDAKVNLLQRDPRSGVKESYIWDYSGTLPIAECRGAAQTDIAYTSFESSAADSWFGINYSNAVGNASFTGEKSLTGAFSLSKSSLSTTSKYVVSYWSKNGSYTVNGGTASSSKSAGGWSYFEHAISNPAGGTVTVTGNGALDELRLYLAGAQMKTYTYEPLIGVTSVCDINNDKTNYKYDKLGRLLFITDDNNQILKKYCYNYQGQSTGCNIYLQNVAKSGTYVKACSAGYTGSSVTYIVPVNSYYSTISVADANNQAQADVTANGQNFANSFGTCTATPVMRDIRGYNSTSTSYRAKFTDASNTYIFDLNAGTSVESLLGQVPSGTYDIDFVLAGSPNTVTCNVFNGTPPTLSHSSTTGYKFLSVSVSATTKVYIY